CVLCSLHDALPISGVGEGDRVLLVAGNHQEWVQFAFAVWAARAVLVPVSPSASAERLAHVVRQARPATALVESDRAARVVSGLQREIPDLGRVWRPETGLARIVALGAALGDCVGGK